eukprot:TRINITY_DN7065_c0_g1_i1.p1 TRINITY_DN7065_c0_g1~~TRINITY_DN7065_c0_g1_i1.p1  ORF type:complete len:399 (+),score=81.21 TRINITY_DN7065_c0_g1_i1:72-1268(+)
MGVHDTPLVLPPLAPSLSLADAIDLLRKRTGLKESISCPALVSPGGTSGEKSAYCDSKRQIAPRLEFSPKANSNGSKFSQGKSRSFGGATKKEKVESHGSLKGLKKAASTTQLPKISKTPGKVRPRDDERYGSRPTSKEGQQVSKQAAAAFWGMPLPPEEEAPIPQEEDDPGNLESVAGKKGFPLNELHRATSVPFEDVKEACRVFKRFAANSDADDVMDLRMMMSDFARVLCLVCQVNDTSDLDPEFLSEAFKCADRDGGGDIDIWEFVIWYSAFSFSEAVCLNKGAQDVRKLSRMFNVSIMDVDRYKKAFDRFDTDKSGFIEFDEFANLLSQLLKVPTGAELPRERVMKMWRTADSDGSGSIDFEEFVKFYRHCFDDRTGQKFDPFADYYKSFRKL